MRPTGKGFTLIELLIVISILGIMAMIVVPHYVGASVGARGASLADQMRIIREQVNVYRAQHMGRWPGVAANGSVSSEPDFTVSQLTMYTDCKGNVSLTKTSANSYGPYLPSMPANPISGLNTLKLIPGTATAIPDSSTGWIYQPETGRIWSNQTGNDENGTAYSAY